MQTRATFREQNGSPLQYFWSYNRNGASRISRRDGHSGLQRGYCQFASKKTKSCISLRNGFLTYRYRNFRSQPGKLSSSSRLASISAQCPHYRSDGFRRKHIQNNYYKKFSRRPYRQCLSLYQSLRSSDIDSNAVKTFQRSSYEPIQSPSQSGGSPRSGQFSCSDLTQPTQNGAHDYITYF